MEKFTYDEIIVLLSRFAGSGFQSVMRVPLLVRRMSTCGTVNCLIINVS